MKVSSFCEDGGDDGLERGSVDGGMIAGGAEGDLLETVLKSKARSCARDVEELLHGFAEHRVEV